MVHTLWVNFTRLEECLMVYGICSIYFMVNQYSYSNLWLCLHKYLWLCLEYGCLIDIKNYLDCQTVFYYNFLLGYIHYIWGNSYWGFWIGLYCTLYTSTISPLSPLPTPLNAIGKGFFVLFHISIWSPLTIFHNLNLLHSSTPSH
jgi:hypothetical protein